MTLAPTPDRPLRTDADLLAHAEVVAQDVRPRRTTLWLTMIGADDVPLPVLVPIEDLEPAPEAGFAAAVFDVVGHFVGPGEGGATFLLERPGATAVTRDDVAWDRELRRAGRAAGVAVRGVFVSAGHGVRPVTADDAAGAA